MNEEKKDTPKYGFELFKGMKGQHSWKITAHNFEDDDAMLQKVGEIYHKIDQQWGKGT